MFYKRVFLVLFLVCSFFVPVSATQAASAPLSSLTNIHSGDLIRGVSLPAVYYYGRDGLRYTFPNQKTYQTWYGNEFNQIKWVSDADLAKIQLGGNITYRPGVRLIKIDSDPKTYAVGENGTLRWITTEALAIQLYGNNWNTKIDDVPDAFWKNYQTGPDILEGSDYHPADETVMAIDINRDKNLHAPVYVSVSDNEYSPTSITIQAGTAVQFTNLGQNKHTATATDLSWGTGTMLTNEHFTRYFKTPGTYTFFCSYHPMMKGTIVVQ